MDKHQTQPLIGLSAEPPALQGVAPKITPRNVKLIPTNRMRQAKGWVERIAEPPVEDAQLLAIHGWLSPEGKLYACSFKCHDLLCKALGYRHESDIENAGFCKLSEMAWCVAPRYRKVGLTSEQWATIERWYDNNDLPDSHYMRLFENV